MTVDKLYECFTDDELDRLAEIKASPEWVPASWRRNGKPVSDTKQVNFVISTHLKSRLDKRCAELGITITEYMTALLEVMLS